MEQTAEIQQLGIYQIRLINSFVTAKMDILKTLLNHPEKEQLAAIHKRFEDIDTLLGIAMRRLTPIRGESPPEAEMRRRGVAVYFVEVHNKILETADEAAMMVDKFPLHNYEAEDADIVLRELEILLDILEANRELLGNRTN